MSLCVHFQVLWTLHFTTLLIEHSFSRHLYSSMEHLSLLLSSFDLDVVLAVLNLLYMFSKRSNFISRLAPDKRQLLLTRLSHLAASWGGKDNGFGLSVCCRFDLFSKIILDSFFPAMSQSPPSRHPRPLSTLNSTPKERGRERGKRLQASRQGELPPEINLTCGRAGALTNLSPFSVTVIHVEGLDKMDRTPAAIMEELLEQHQVPKTTQPR